MRRRIERLLVTMFPLRKGACQNERREIMWLRAAKGKQISAQVQEQGESKLIEYEQKAKSASGKRME